MPHQKFLSRSTLQPVINILGETVGEEGFDFEETYKGFKLQGHYFGSLPLKDRAGRGYGVDARNDDYAFSVLGIGFFKDMAENGYRKEKREDQEMVKEQMRDQTIKRVKKRIDEGRHENGGDYEFGVTFTPKSEI